MTSVIWRDRESGQMGEKTEKLKFCNLFVLLVLPVHRTRVRRSNLVLGSQLHRCSWVSSNRREALLPDSSNRRARWRRWQRQRPRRWWPSPHGAWTMLSSSLVFSGIKQKLTMHRQTQHAKQKKTLYTTKSLVCGPLGLLLALWVSFWPFGPPLGPSANTLSTG